MTGDRHLGWSEEELATYRYGHHFHARMAELAPHVLQALANSPVAEELIPTVAADLVDLEHAPIRNGFTVTKDGAIHVHLATPMPGVTPRMIDWWFGWHSDSPERYRLWHPQAHVHAAWLTAPPVGTSGRDRYLGRTSVVEEYLGEGSGRYAIAFRDPAELGIRDPRFADPDVATAICARVGTADAPVDAGWLAHLVVAEGDGSTMYSRFWIGAPYVGARNGGLLDVALKPVSRIARRGIDDARAMLVHCAQEMTHLASFLPAIYAEESSEGR